MLVIVKQQIILIQNNYTGNYIKNYDNKRIFTLTTLKKLVGMI